MATLVEKLDCALYPDFARNGDDQLFRERIVQRLTSATVILDLGAGAGIVQQMNFRGYAAWICDVDLDPRVVD
jgi:predicted RNA methylase